VRESARERKRGRERERESRESMFVHACVSRRVFLSVVVCVRV